jgi:diaminopimelate epimerase
MDFTKLQGVANDFVLIEAEGLERDWPELAKKICDRHLGIGADSVLLLLPSKKADFCMVTYDADGSEAEICGNGLRCLARYVIKKGMVPSDKEEIIVETAAGISRLTPYWENGVITGFRANIGKPGFSAESIPVSKNGGVGEIVDINGLLAYKVPVTEYNLILYLVSMGNPHAVYFTDKILNDYPLSRLGPQVENLPTFVRRTNFEVARVVSKDLIEARVWERGVGETMACGSGACAIFVVSGILGYTSDKVDIKLPGGIMNLEYSENSEVILSGPAEIVYEGKWPD